MSLRRLWLLGSCVFSSVVACNGTPVGALDLAGPAPPPDLRAPPPLVDLAQRDLAQPDLAQPDLAQPDLAQPDLAQPDLSPPLGSAGNPAAGCRAILAARAGAGDGVYWIAAGGATFQARCDMTADGGGWTLLLRGLRANAAGWGSTAAVNLSSLSELAAVRSSKAADAAINAVLTVGYRVQTSGCTNTAMVAKVYFKADCQYQHNTDTVGACQTFYASSALAGGTQGMQYGGYQALSSYTDATRTTTAIIVHDPVSGLGNDSWWSGGANLCDLDVWVK